MEQVGLREANIHFAKYVKKVKEGQEILLTDRGEPVAIIKPVMKREEPIEKRLHQMEKDGLLRRASGKKFSLPKLVELPGRPLSEMVIEDRKNRI
jgi:prevent-host-death family protein